MERKCKTCRLFNEKDSLCSVTILHENEKYNLKVKSEDCCHWDRLEEEISEELQREISSSNDPYVKEKLRKELDSIIEIKQIRLFSDEKHTFIEY